MVILQGADFKLTTESHHAPALPISFGPRQLSLPLESLALRRIDPPATWPGSTASQWSEICSAASFSCGDGAGSAQQAEHDLMSIEGRARRWLPSWRWRRPNNAEAITPPHERIKSAVGADAPASRLATQGCPAMPTTVSARADFASPRRKAHRLAIFLGLGLLLTTLTFAAPPLYAAYSLTGIVPAMLLTKSSRSSRRCGR